MKVKTEIRHELLSGDVLNVTVYPDWGMAHNGWLPNVSHSVGSVGTKGWFFNWGPEWAFVSFRIPFTN